MEVVNTQEVIELEKKEAGEVSEAATDKGKDETKEVTASPEVEDKKEAVSPEDIVAGKNKTPKGVQKRIDELTREKYELKRQLEEEKTKKEILPPPIIKERPVPPAELEFADTAEFKKARIKYEDEINEWQEAKVSASNYAKRQAEGRKALEDKFITDASRVADKYEDFAEAINTMWTTPALSQAILASDYAPEIGYYLAKNPEIAAKIVGKDIITIGREIGKLEARFGDASKRVISNAPAPLPIVDAIEGELSDDPSKMDMAEYMAWEKKRELGKIRKKLGG